MSSSSSPPRVVCPQCQAALKVISVEPNQKLTCPKCGTAFVTPNVPAAEGGSARPVVDILDLDDFSLEPPVERTASARPAPPTTPSTSTRTPISTPSPQATAAPQPAKAASSKTNPPPRSGCPVVKSDVVKSGLVKSDEGPLRLDDDITDANEPSPSGPAANVGSPNPTAMNTGARPPAAPERAVAKEPVLPVAAPADLIHFTFNCRVCATPQDATSQDVGRTITCPDCHSELVIPPPKAHQRRYQHDERGFDDGTTLDIRPASGNDQKPPPISQAVRNSANNYLTKAAEAVAKEESEEFEKSASGDLTEAFRFAIEPNTIVYLLGISAGLWGLVAILNLSGLRSEALSSQTIRAIFLIPIIAVLGCIWLSWISASLLAVMRDTGVGGKQVGWPGANFTEWMFEGISLLVGLLVSCLPAIGLGLVMKSSGSELQASFFLRAFIALCIYGIFPIVMLSIMHGGTITALVSRTVLRSMPAAPKYWFTFFQVTAFCAVVSLFATYPLLFGDIGLGLAAFLAVLNVANWFLYFRMLGWLAWRLGETWQLIEDSGESPP